MRKGLLIFFTSFIIVLLIPFYAYAQNTTPPGVQNRIEAKEIGFDNILMPSPKLEDLIWRLYCEYEKEMNLNAKFNHVEEFIKANPTIPQGQILVHKLPRQKAVYIESDGFSHVNTIDFEIIGTRLPNGIIQAQLSTLRQDWEEE